jgi:hypothetical protein
VSMLSLAGTHGQGNRQHAATTHLSPLHRCPALQILSHPANIIMSLKKMLNKLRKAMSFKKTLNKLRKAIKTAAQRLAKQHGQRTSVFTTPLLRTDHAAAAAAAKKLAKPAAVALHVGKLQQNSRVVAELAVVVDPALRPPVQLQSVRSVSSNVLEVCAALEKRALYGEYAAKQALWATLRAKADAEAARHAVALAAQAAAHAAQAAALAAAQAAAALVAQAKADLEAAHHAVMQELFYAQFDSVAKVRATLLELELFPLR